MADWFSERSGVCTMDSRALSYRCNQAICDFADAIFPEMPPTKSINVTATAHDGIFRISPAEIPAYVAQYQPLTVLRHDKNTDTAGLPAMNFGVAKGRTFDRVMIFPTRPMIQYLHDLDPTALKEREKLYVAVTRARYSVAFVVPSLRKRGAVGSFRNCTPATPRV